MPLAIRLPNGDRLRPLPARSAVLSTLLGTEGGSLGAYDLVLVGREFDIGDSTLRASISRMLTAGDLVREDGRYRLSARLLDRQRRQDEAAEPPAKQWDGTWHLAVVTTSGRPSNERADLRATLRRLRLAELREGVWLRPANIAIDLAGHPEVNHFTQARPDIDPQELVRRLWDLPGWSATAKNLLDGFHSADTRVARFTITAAIVRHLLDEPALPPTLLPEDHPVSELRRAYAQFRQELDDVRHRANATRRGTEIEPV